MPAAPTEDVATSALTTGAEGQQLAAHGEALLDAAEHEKRREWEFEDPVRTGQARTHPVVSTAL